MRDKPDFWDNLFCFIRVACPPEDSVIVVSVGDWESLKKAIKALEGKEG